MGLDRRGFMLGAASGALALRTGAARGAEFYELPFANGKRAMATYPGKRPLIQLTARPPQLETPFPVFNEGIITPNDAFFVRYHLSGIPLEIDEAKFRLSIAGKVDKPLSLSLSEIKAMEPIEVVAVNQCSGNSRGFFEPRVAGGQLANGAMGNARWKGVPLKALLDAAGVQAGSRQVTFNGLDEPADPATPDFVKALDIDQARDGEVMVAYAMNGEDLPFLNGYPLRLVVPGHYGTYWVKHLNEITVIDSVFDGLWMTVAYRIPANACACTEPGKAPASTVPISRFDVRSFVTSHTDGAKVAANKPVALRGIAFDGGFGITEVAVSADGGRTWQGAQLGEDLGRYSFREWKTAVKLPPGEHQILVRAVNRIGQSQPMQPLWNPPGYMRNVVETIHVRAA
jgi:sulfite dehydrogenase